MEVVFLYVREDIPSRELKIYNTPDETESIFVKIDLIKTKWLFCGCYHTPGQSDQYFFENIGKTLDKYSKDYNKFMLLDEKAYHNSFMNAMPRTLSRKTLVLKMH